MFPTKHLTPLLFGYRSCVRVPPQQEMVAVVRGRFTLVPGQPVELLKNTLRFPDVDPEDRTAETDALLEKAEYVLAQGALRGDVYGEDDPERVGMLLYADDMAEYKPKADILVRANCYPPEGAAAECPVQIRVGSYKKSLTVIGPRAWVDKVGGGKATDPMHFKMIPIDYAHAFGGEGFEANPIGRGFKTDELPRIEHPKRRIRSAGQVEPPAGFGPISPSWPQRSRKLGKNYGTSLATLRWPYYADDFDWTYFNAAPEDQQLSHYLRGDEELSFVNMHPEAASFEAKLPQLRPRVFIERTGGERVEIPMALDTLFADLIDGELFLTWRGHVHVESDDLAEVAYGLVAHEKTYEEPKPAAHYLDQLAAFSADPTGFEASPAAALRDLEEDIETGRLEAEIDALPPDQDPLAMVVGRAVAIGAPEEAPKVSADIKKSVDEAAATDPSIREKIKEELKQALRDSGTVSGSAGGGMKPGKGTNIGLSGPLQQLFKSVADTQKTAAEAGLDISDDLKAFEERIAELDLDEVRDNPDKFSIEAAMVEPVEPGPDRDLSGQDYSKRDLRGYDLSGSDLSGANLSGANLSGVNMARAKLSHAILSKAELSYAELCEADLTLCQLIKTNLANANLKGAVLEQCFAMKSDFSRADLREIKASSTILQRSTFAGARFDGAELSFCFFGELDLSEASFVRANLTRSMFHKCTMPRACFDHADVSRGGFFSSDLSSARLVSLKADGASWLDSTLSEADFSYGVMPSSLFVNVTAVGAKLRAVDMPEARFYRAVLRGADFRTSNLYAVDLRKAVLTAAQFQGANMYLAQLTDSSGNDPDFTDANLEMANFKNNRLVMKS